MTAVKVFFGVALEMQINPLNLINDNGGRMKTIILIFVTVAGSMGWAVDFNSLIQENVNAQKSLYQEIKKTVTDTQIAAQKHDLKYISDEKEVIVQKVNKDFLTPEKEKMFYKASRQATEKRLAQELQDLE